MNKQHSIANITLWANRVVMAGMVVLLFTLKYILNWYEVFRQLLPVERTAIVIAFYCCSVFIFWALWNMEGLLKAILADQVFIKENVKRIRRIQWCCTLVSLICIPACFAYMPLLLVTVIMAFLSLTVNVLACVMDSAVAIREENDLTI